MDDGKKEECSPEGLGRGEGFGWGDNNDNERCVGDKGAEVLEGT